MPTKCFWLEPTDKQATYLRRYSSSEAGACPTTGFCHNAKVRIEDREDIPSKEIDPASFAEDVRWPPVCACGYVFDSNDERQVWTDGLYRRSDTGEVIPLRDAPPGAMWDAYWFPNWKGEDGRTLIVKLPNGNDWVIDSQCSNCTIRDDRLQEHHHCWIRHGEPPNITVDKAGITCGAGGGSIQSGDYHGFLQGGILT